MSKTEAFKKKVKELVKEIARTDQAAPDSYYTDKFLKICDGCGLVFFFSDNDGMWRVEELDV